MKCYCVQAWFHHVELRGRHEFVQKVDSAIGIRGVNHYPLDSAIGFPKIYPLKIDFWKAISKACSTRETHQSHGPPQ